jgi:hypothetical protein
MKCGEKILVCFLSSLALGMPATAVVTDDREAYHGIVERNVFSLKPPAPVVPPEPPAPPAPKIKLNGIFTILGGKRAGLTVSIPPKPPDPAREDSFILAEGQRRGEVEVLQIDEIAGTVKLKNHGTLQSLNFTNDGAKLVNVPPPPPAPGMPQSIPNPGGISGNPAVPGNTALRTIPPRAMRLPPTPNAGGQQPGTTPSPMPGAYGSAIAQPNSYVTQPDTQLSHEQQMIMIEVERERTRDAVSKGLMPPPPHTPITQDRIPPPQGSP